MRAAQAYWEWAKTEPAIQGIAPWHWADRISMPPNGFARGAVSCGPQVKQWMQWIGGNVSAALPASKCIGELQTLCGAQKKAGAAACGMCSGTNAGLLHSAGCSNAQIQSWCSNTRARPVGA